MQELAAGLEIYTADSAMSETGQILLPHRHRWTYMAMGGVAVAAVALAVFLFLRSGGDDEGQTEAPRLPAAADPALRVPTAHGGDDVAEPPVSTDPGTLADAAPADLADPAAEPQPPADAPEAAPTAEPAKTGKRRKRRPDDENEPGSLYDSPTGKLRLPR